MLMCVLNARLQWLDVNGQPKINPAIPSHVTDAANFRNVSKQPHLSHRHCKPVLPYTTKRIWFVLFFYKERTKLVNKVGTELGFYTGTEIWYLDLCQAGTVWLTPLCCNSFNPDALDWRVPADPALINTTINESSQLMENEAREKKAGSKQDSYTDRKSVRLWSEFLIYYVGKNINSCLD